MQQNVPEFLELLTALNDADVRYVVIGGLAMILHGSSYVTFDLDLAIALDPDNVAATVRALERFHPRPHEYARANVPFVLDERSFFGPVVELVTDVGLIDILRVLPGIGPFDDLHSRSESRIIDDLEIKVASIDDLIAMKREAGRPKDLEHIRQLEALRRLREKG